MCIYLFFHSFVFIREFVLFLPTAFSPNSKSGILTTEIRNPTLFTVLREPHFLRQLKILDESDDSGTYAAASNTILRV